MEFPHLGQHCTEPSCQQLDYLPLKCDACSKIFCKEHINYSTHSCDSAYKKDCQVPVCPLCSTPIPVKRGEPPDIAVGAHIDSDCQSFTAKDRRKIFTNKCSAKGCHVKEVVPVTCSDCRLNFCLKHRHPTDHNCEGQQGAMRRRAAEAAAARQSISNGPNYQTRPPNVSLASVQGNMSEDEALARAIALSLHDNDGRRPQRSSASKPLQCHLS